MLDYNVGEEDLLKFYNIKTLQPKSKSDLNISEISQFNAEQLQNLSTDEQFTILSKLINPATEERNYSLNNRDVEDPLKGNGTDIIKNLIDQGVIQSPHDPELNRYLISSQKFNPNQFLTVVHQNTPINELVTSLDFLERNIQSQTNELREVIDANFIKFINCKQAIDNVLVTFKALKTKAQKDRERSKVFNPRDFRDKSTKNESLYSELEESINSLNMTSALMIRPIMENKNKETKLIKLIEFVKSHQFFFDLPTNLIGYLTNHNQDQFIDDYHKFINEKYEFLTIQEKRYQEELEKVDKKDTAKINALEQDQMLINTALSKVFNEVDLIVKQFRKKTFKELKSLNYQAGSTALRSIGISQGRFFALVEKLYQLADSKEGSTSNPIYEFLNVQLLELDNELGYQIKKIDSKWALMQRKLQDYMSSLSEARKNGSHVRYIGDKYNQIEDYFRATNYDSGDRRSYDIRTDSSSEKADVKLSERIKTIKEVFDSSENMDISIVNETWLVLNNFISYLDGLFLTTLKKFVANYKHFHQFNIDFDGKIMEGLFALIEKVSVVLVTLFDDESGDNNQLESSPNNYRQFLPHYTNSLSTIYYLTGINQKINRLMTTLGESVGTVGNLSKSTETNKHIKHLKTSSSKVNQKIIEAICSVWVNDCSQLYDLENWEVLEKYMKETRGKEENDEGAVTKLTKIIFFYQGYILDKLAQVIFLSDVENSEFRIVSAFPSKRTLVSIEIQFMRSLNIIIDSVLKKYNIERKLEMDNKIDGEGTFKILTMNNFDELSQKIYPQLIKRFDRLFDKNLLQQKLKLFVDIDKAGLTIFEDVLNKEKLWIRLKVNKFFNGVDGRKVLKIDGFIYEILIHFVKLINKVKPISGKDIFTSIINELQMFFLKNILDSLRETSGLDAIQLINLKLDVNFFMEVFEISKPLRFNDLTFKVLEITLNGIDEKLSQAGGADYSKKEFNAILEQNLKDSKNQFDCF
jgi:exocyst complex component 2